MPRTWPVLALSVMLGVGACQAATSGEMTSQTYRSLDARGDALTADDVREAGGTDDPDLARTFVREGGSAEPSGASCLYARIGESAATIASPGDAVLLSISTGPFGMSTSNR